MMSCFPWRLPMGNGLLSDGGGLDSIEGSGTGGKRS